MVFWIFIFFAVVGLICEKLAELKAAKSETYTTKDETFGEVSYVVFWLAVFFAALSLFIMAFMYISAPGRLADNEQTYQALSAQVENGLYDNNNDIGRKQLADEVRDYNVQIARGKAMQRNLWVGIYVPNIYDDLDFIDLSQLK